MELTGRCKQDFDGWMLSTHPEDDFTFRDYTLGLFYDLPEAMKFGALQDFAKQRLYIINTEYKNREGLGCLNFVSILTIYSEVLHIDVGYVDNSLCREETIRQFNNIYNQKAC